MKKWTDLETDLKNWLNNIADLNNLEYRNSNQAIIGFPSDGPRSDGMIIVGNTLIAIEVEAGQTHPDTNTGKYWLLYDHFRKYDKILLFHIYTPQFNSYGWRKKLAEFYIEKMSKSVPLDYHLIDLRGSEEYNSVLKLSKTRITKQIKKMIPTMPDKKS